jgi:hypothetical protein
MDETHVHFFTRKTLTELLHSQGFVVDKCKGSADFGQLPLIGRLARHIPKSIQFSISQLWSSLLSVQWLTVAHMSKTHE